MNITKTINLKMFITLSIILTLPSGILSAEDIIDDFLAETNPFSFLKTDSNDFLYPAHHLKNDKNRIEIAGNLMDIFRETKENGDYNYLYKQGIGVSLTKLFLYNERKSIISVGYVSDCLEGNFPSVNLSGPVVPSSSIKMSFATSFGPHDVGISYKYSSQSTSATVRLDPFAESDIPNENKYLLDPLENFFGTSYILGGSNTGSTIILEDHFHVLSGHSLDIRFLSHSESYNYYIQYTNNETETRYIDIPINRNLLKGEINYYLNLGNRWKFKFFFADSIENTQYELNQRDADPETEIVSYGNSDFNISTINMGAGSHYKIDDKTKSYLKFKYNSASGLIPLYFSTPDLKSSGFIPIVHRLTSTGTLNIPIFHIEYGYEKDFSEKFNFNMLAGYLFSGSTINLDGELKLIAGLDNYSIDEGITIDFGLIHLKLEAKYKLFKYAAISYKLFANIPYYTIIRKGFEPAPDDTKWRVKGGGGLEHTLSFSIIF